MPQLLYPVLSLALGKNWGQTTEIRVDVIFKLGDLRNFRSGIDERKIAVQLGRAKAETGEKLRPDQKSAIVDFQLDAPSGVAVEQGTEGDRGRAAGLKVADQEISGLPGREQAMAEQDVLALNVRLGSIENLCGRGGGVKETLHVGLDELADNISGDRANQVGDEDETIF